MDLQAEHGLAEHLSRREREGPAARGWDGEGLQVLRGASLYSLFGERSSPHRPAPAARGFGPLIIAMRA